jgi:hypothetical protein
MKRMGRHRGNDGTGRVVSLEFEKDTLKMPKSGIHSGSRGGWDEDAFKFFPAIKMLHQQYPDKDWYILVDDDSYVFWENLEDILKGFNPNEPLYLGKQVPYSGCGIFTGEPWTFAHGGSGIFISRGGMEKILTRIDTCTIGCECGDIALATCFKHVGIKLTHIPHLSGSPPSVQKKWPINPCDRPTTYHHLTGAQFQIAHNAHSENKHTNFGDILKHMLKYSYPELHYFKDGGYTGHDIEEVDMSTVTNDRISYCRDRCNENSKCFAWMLDQTKNACYLKGELWTVESMPGHVFGYSLENYQCKT